MSQIQRATNGEPVSIKLDFEEACRLLNDARDELARWVEDPASARGQAARNLIDDLRSCHGSSGSTEPSR